MILQKTLSVMNDHGLPEKSDGKRENRPFFRAVFVFFDHVVIIGNSSFKPTMAEAADRDSGKQLQLRLLLSEDLGTKEFDFALVIDHANVSTLRIFINLGQNNYVFAISLKDVAPFSASISRFVPRSIRWSLLNVFTPFSRAWHDFICKTCMEYFDDISQKSINPQETELFLAVRKIRLCYRPDGYMAHIDAYDGRSVSGWIKKKDSDNPCEITLYQDDAPVGTAFMADGFRGDLLANAIGNGKYGFHAGAREPRTSFATFVLCEPDSKNILAFHIFATNHAPRSLYLVSIDTHGRELSGIISSIAANGALMECELFLNDIFVEKIVGRLKIKPEPENFRLYKFKMDSPLNYFAYGSQALKIRFPDGSFSDTIVVSGGRKPKPLYNLAKLERFSIIMPINKIDANLAKCLEVLFVNRPQEAKFFFPVRLSAQKKFQKLVEKLSPHFCLSIMPVAESAHRAEMLNMAAAAAGSDNFIIINCPIWTHPRWWQYLAMELDNPEVGLSFPFFPPVPDNLPYFTQKSEGCDAIDDFAKSIRRSCADLIHPEAKADCRCMLIRRECFEDIGKFNAPAFSTPEEDFHRRASGLGWRSILAIRSPVFNLEEVNPQKIFSARRDSIPEGANGGDTDIPGAWDAIKSALTAHAMKSANINFHARIKPRILFITSTTSGGTPKTNMELMVELENIASCYHMRCDSRAMFLSRLEKGRLVPISSRTLKERLEPFSHASPEYDAVFARWLLDMDIDIVHIRSFIWQSLNIVEISKKLDRKVVCSFHDYYCSNPNLNYLDDSGVFMGDNMLSTGSVYRVNMWENYILPVECEDYMAFWRSRMGGKIKDADAFITTSGSMRAHILRDLQDIDADKFHIIPHGKTFDGFFNVAQSLLPGEKIRILVLGNISFHKGLGIINSMIDYDAGHLEALEFHVLGTCPKGASEKLIMHGAYAKDELSGKLMNIRPHAAIVFSITNESWCHALTELWAHGLPVFALDYGTLGERFKDNGSGWILTDSDIPEYYSRILSVMRDAGKRREALENVEQWRAGTGILNDCAYMASKYYNIYRGLLAGFCPHACKVLALCLNNGTATSYIRVLERCRNDFKRGVVWIPMKPAQLMSAMACGGIDGVCIQRDALPKTLVDDFIGKSKEKGIPYFLEMDDDLFSVPPEIDSYPIFVSYRPYLEKLAANAALITVSTPMLKERLERFGRPIQIFENRLSWNAWNAMPAKRENDDYVRALYFGTYGHRLDLDMVLPAFDEAVKICPNLRLLLVGISSRLDDAAAGRDYIEIIDIPSESRPYPKFCAFLRHVSAMADFGIAPLRSTPFNKCKSALKIYEYGALGLPVIASAGGPYDDLRDVPHLRLCLNEIDPWREGIISFAENGRQNRKNGIAARAYIIANYMLSHEELARWDCAASGLSTQ